VSLQEDEGTNTEMLAIYLYTSQAKAIRNTIPTSKKKLFLRYSGQEAFCMYTDQNDKITF